MTLISDWLFCWMLNGFSIDFKHQFDTPSDAAGHIKSSLIGVSMTFIITGGKLLLGGSQGIYFLEHDGPRNRSYYVKVIEG